MALNSSGPISIAGSTAGQSINLELGLAAGAQSSLNDSALRTLANIASGQISLYDFYGKSAGAYPLGDSGTYTFTGSIPPVPWFQAYSVDTTLSYQTNYLKAYSPAQSYTDCMGTHNDISFNQIYWVFPTWCKDSTGTFSFDFQYTQAQTGSKWCQLQFLTVDGNHISYVNTAAATAVNTWTNSGTITIPAGAMKVVIHSPVANPGYTCTCYFDNWTYNIPAPTMTWDHVFTGSVWPGADGFIPLSGANDNTASAGMQAGYIYATASTQTYDYYCSNTGKYTYASQVMINFDLRKVLTSAMGMAVTWKAYDPDTPANGSAGRIYWSQNSINWTQIEAAGLNYSSWTNTLFTIPSGARWVRFESTRTKKTTSSTDIGRNRIELDRVYTT